VAPVSASDSLNCAVSGVRAAAASDGRSTTRCSRETVEQAEGFAGRVNAKRVERTKWAGGVQVALLPAEVPASREPGLSPSATAAHSRRNASGRALFDENATPGTPAVLSLASTACSVSSAVP